MSLTMFSVCFVMHLYKPINTGGTTCKMKTVVLTPIKPPIIFLFIERWHNMTIYMVTSHYKYFYDDNSV